MSHSHALDLPALKMRPLAQAEWRYIVIIKAVPRVEEHSRNSFALQ